MIIYNIHYIINISAYFVKLKVKVVRHEFLIGLCSNESFQRDISNISGL